MNNQEAFDIWFVRRYLRKPNTETNPEDLGCWQAWEAATEATWTQIESDANARGNSLNTASCAYLDSFRALDEVETGKHFNAAKTLVRDALLSYFDAIRKNHNS